MVSNVAYMKTHPPTKKREPPTNSVTFLVSRQGGYEGTSPKETGGRPTTTGRNETNSGDSRSSSRRFASFAALFVLHLL